MADHLRRKVANKSGSSSANDASPTGATNRQAVASQIFRSMKAWRDREDAGADLDQDTKAEKIQTKKVHRSGDKESSGLDKLNNGAGAGLEMAATAGKIGAKLPPEVAAGLGAAKDFLGIIGTGAMVANLLREWGLAAHAIHEYLKLKKAAKTDTSQKAAEDAAKEKA